MGVTTLTQIWVPQPDLLEEAHGCDKVEWVKRRKNNFFPSVWIISFWFIRDFGLALGMKGEAKGCGHIWKSLPEVSFLWLGPLSVPFPTDLGEAHGVVQMSIAS